MISWRQIQKENIRSLKVLAQILEVDLPFTSTPQFPLNIPKRLVDKMEKGNPKDPLLLQFLPRGEELTPPPGFVEDPVGDCTVQKTPRLLQKYKGQALLVTTGTCVMNCRFCFRQNYPYTSEGDFSEELQLIRNDPSLHEVILSGGDPLSLSDKTLTPLLQSLDAIPHIKLIRFHTRFPIGIPERITQEFISLLSSLRAQPITVLHTNHPHEIDDTLFAYLKNLPGLLLSQTVLLKEVNDSFATLKELFLELASHGVIPYYLHQLDPVKQAHHFEVPIEKGKELIDVLRKELPGYAVPTYVQERPSFPYKSPLS